MDEGFTVIGVHDGKQYIAWHVEDVDEDWYEVALAKTLFGFVYGYDQNFVVFYSEDEFMAKFTEAP
jgi:hypothetical protein